MNKKKELGRKGEEIVCKYLIDNGHTILERNWRCGHLEIDIISINKIGIHFVEVKSRVVPMQVAPEENVNRGKQRKIARAAIKYLAQKAPVDDIEVLMDVAAVSFEGGRTCLDYFEGAYVPTYL